MRVRNTGCSLSQVRSSGVSFNSDSADVTGQVVSSVSNTASSTKATDRTDRKDSRTLVPMLRRVTARTAAMTSGIILQRVFSLNDWLAEFLLMRPGLSIPIMI